MNYYNVAGSQLSGVPGSIPQTTSSYNHGSHTQSHVLPAASAGRDINPNVHGDVPFLEKIRPYQEYLTRQAYENVKQGLAQPENKQPTSARVNLNAAPDEVTAADRTRPTKKRKSAPGAQNQAQSSLRPGGQGRISSRSERREGSINPNGAHVPSLLSRRPKAPLHQFFGYGGRGISTSNTLRLGTVVTPQIMASSEPSTQRAKHSGSHFVTKDSIYAPHEPRISSNLSERPAISPTPVVTQTPTARDSTRMEQLGPPVPFVSLSELSMDIPPKQ